METLARQLNENEIEVFTELRKEERKNVVIPCTLHSFSKSISDLIAEEAVTRNISTGGVGLLIERPMVRGEPGEVVLNQGTSKLFLAGLVAFCRHIDGRIHEIGLQFVSHSVTPIISGDGAATARTHSWVERALDAKLSGEQCSLAQ